MKCPVSDPSLAGGECIERIVEEIAIVQPRIVVVMGERALETLNEVDVPLSRTLEPRSGEIQELTPTIDALYVPDIDESLDSEESEARVLGARSARSATGTPTCRPTEPTRALRLVARRADRDGHVEAAAHALQHQVLGAGSETTSRRWPATS